MLASRIVLRLPAICAFIAPSICLRTNTPTSTRITAATSGQIQNCVRRKLRERARALLRPGAWAEAAAVVSVMGFLLSFIRLACRRSGIPPHHPRTPRPASILCRAAVLPQRHPVAYRSFKRSTVTELAGKV